MTKNKPPCPIFDTCGGLSELATIFACGYLRLLKRHAGENPSVKERGSDPGLDVPANPSPAWPTVNGTATANHAPKGGRK
jgi:hypothetical protein